MPIENPILKGTDVLQCLLKQPLSKNCVLPNELYRVRIYCASHQQKIFFKIKYGPNGIVLGPSSL